jgi:hypothetical protein
MIKSQVDISDDVIDPQKRKSSIIVDVPNQMDQIFDEKIGSSLQLKMMN